MDKTGLRSIFDCNNLFYDFLVGNKLGSMILRTITNFCGSFKFQQTDFRSMFDSWRTANLAYPEVVGSLILLRKSLIVSTNSTIQG